MDRKKLGNGILNIGVSILILSILFILLRVFGVRIPQIIGILIASFWVSLVIIVIGATIGGNNVNKK